jgi:hypothetical protein
LTPLERPAAMAERAFLTEEEASALDSNSIDQVLKRFAAGVAISGELNAAWLEESRVVRSRRTSLIVDPPDGRIPFTPEGKARWDAVPTIGRPLRATAPEDRTLPERCLNADDIVLPNPFYANNHQIVQAPGYVATHSEVMHEMRIIPLDGRPHLPSSITQWLGDSRGRWDGETLVIETTNFNDKRRFQGATGALRLVERLTRVNADTMDYELTVSDPATFTRPWTMINTLRTTRGPIYEFACHEGNYGLVGILQGARVQEREAAR